MTAVKEIVIKQDGSTMLRSVTESPVSFEESLVAQLQSKVNVRLEQVFDPPHEAFGYAGLTIRNGEHWWRIPVSYIPLRCPYKLEGDILTPAFEQPDMTKLTINWTPPYGMRVFLGIKVVSNVVNPVYLVAFGPDNQAYRLPLSNLYDNCTLCSGEYRQRHATSAQCVVATIEQFVKSEWNADLYATKGDGDKDKTRRMFRFKAEGAEFEQQDILLGDRYKDWTQLCEPVSLTVITENLTP